MFYKKIRFWGGLGMAFQPIFFNHLSTIWIVIGLIISLSSFRNVSLIQFLMAIAENSCLKKN